MALNMINENKKESYTLDELINFGELVKKRTDLRPIIDLSGQVKKLTVREFETGLRILFDTDKIIGLELKGDNGLESHDQLGS